MGLKSIVKLIVAVIGGLTIGCQPQSVINPPAVGASEGRHFSLSLKGRVTWLTAPDGGRFFSLGVNCVNRGDINAPVGSTAYRAASTYANDENWAAATIHRLQTWGFTTIGGWSDWELLESGFGHRFFHTPVLHVGSAAGAPWRDLWDSRWETVMGERAHATMQGNSSQTIGYYADNELGWWNGALFRETMGQPPTSGQRQRLIALLRETYENDWEKLLRDFDPDGAASFGDLEKSGRVYLREGGSGIRVCRRFLTLIADRYYQLTSAAIREEDRSGLLLGDRYASSYYPELVRAAAGNVDVISTNFKASWNDGTFARFFLDSIHRLSGKPVIIGEIYMAAMENASGNHNRNGGFPTVATQSERAAATERSLVSLARLPYVVGVDWFQYYDESPDGRFDGEDFNMGLVDIYDRPYTNLVSMLTKLNLTQIHQQGGADRSTAKEGVPLAPQNPLGSWAPREALRQWDRERGFVPAVEGIPFADLYVCWNADELFIGVYAMDLTEGEYYRDRKVPDVDRMEWQLKLGGSPDKVAVRLGTAGHEVRIESGTIGGLEFKTLAYETRAIAVMRVPARKLGKAALASGDIIEIESSLESQGRAEHMGWKGQFSLK